MGFWDATSPIAVRLLAIGHASFAARSGGRTPGPRRWQPGAPRLDPVRTNAFRWVHGEADRLPGLHLDLYGDVAAVRFDGAGARAFYRQLPDLLAATARPLRLRAAIDRETRQPLAGAGQGHRPTRWPTRRCWRTA